MNSILLSSLATQLAFCAAAFAAPVTTTLQGPEEPPPFDRVFMQTGLPNDGLWGRAGGKIFTFSNVDHADRTDVFWGIADGGVRLSLDGPDYTAQGEIMSFDAALSDLPNGVAVWTGQTTIICAPLGLTTCLPENAGGPATVYTRFKITVSVHEDTVPCSTCAPVALVPASTWALPESVGALIPFQNSASAVDINLLFTASELSDSGFEPHLDFFDPRTNGDQELMANSSVDHGFYWVNVRPFLTVNASELVAEGGTITLNNAHLAADDFESDPAQITFTMDPDNAGGAPHDGTLLRNGVPLASLDTFTQQDIDDLLITYEHDGSEDNLDGFTFNVRDEQGELAADGGFTVFQHRIDVILIDDPPVPVHGSGVADMVGVFNGQLQATDDDTAPPDLTFAITGYAPAAATVVLNDATSGSFTFTAPSGYSGAASVDFEVSDLTTTVPGGLFDITVPDPTLPIIDHGDLLIANGDQLILHNLPANTDWVLSEGGLLTKLSAIAFADPDRIYLLDSNSGLVQVDPDTGSQTVIADGSQFYPNSPGSIAVEDEHHVLVADLDVDFGPALLRVETATGTVTELAAGGMLPLITTVGVGPDGRIFCGDASALGSGLSALIEVDPTNGSQSMVSLGGMLMLPMGIAVEPGGSVLVADGPVGLGMGGVNRLLRIDPDMGPIRDVGVHVAPPPEQSMLTEGGFLLERLDDVAVGLDGRIYVTNSAMVIEVDPVTGLQMPVPGDPMLDSPSDVAVVVLERVFGDSFEGSDP